MDEKPSKTKDPERSQVVRLAKGQANKLDQISKKMGTTQAQIVRWAIDALIVKVEKAGGKLVLPFELDLGGEPQSGDDAKPHRGSKQEE